jgi:hypothetical protein
MSAQIIQLADRRKVPPQPSIVIDGLTTGLRWAQVGCLFGMFVISFHFIAGLAITSAGLALLEQAKRP